MGSNGQASTIHGETPSLRISRGSHAIGKGNLTSASNWPKAQRPPVIRVVHIFNPTVIKTDAANFRSLVQKLTGKNYKPKKHPTSKSHKKAALIPVDDHRTGPMKPPVFEAQLQKDAANGDQFVGCYSFTDPMMNTSAFFESSDSDSDQKAPIFEVSPAMRDQINPGEGMKMCYIPERLGIFNDELDLGSPEPLPDCTMLPPLNGIATSDQGMFNSMQRFSTFFNTVESFSCTYDHSSSPL
ncbi:hypothetical protein O6H91_01G171900 [Diphasiastrum complanatum]|uniref:Uncharacterized protein n=1 Tax=Diphasiastrum complanatum TaxID=34168 RepID=A0ACC2EZ62_DIPCM|nr:hypothetical protein O6H91_01G171900 [Diphasiastrum complanatum]